MGVSLGLITVLFGALYNHERALNSERHDQTSNRILEISRRKQIIGAEQDKLARQVSEFIAHFDDHKEEAREWKNRIREVERRVISLSSDANARPDPWTGTQGRAEARRTDKLELIVDKFEFFIPEIIKLREDVRKLKEAAK